MVDKNKIKKKKWYTTWWFITLAIIGLIIFISLITGTPIISIETENRPVFESNLLENEYVDYNYDFNYEFTDINKTINAKEKSTGYDVDITLVKFGIIYLDNQKVIRVYWEVNNKDNDTICVNPINTTVIVTTTGDFFYPQNKYKYEDDFDKGNVDIDYRCCILPDTKIYGGVNIYDIPKEFIIEKILFDEFDSASFNILDILNKTDNDINDCNLDECESKTDFVCEDTTKVITTYFCDDELGCINEIIRDENNTDCGYLFSGKYTLADIDDIKYIAKDCRINLDDCIDELEYILPKIKLGYEALYSYPTGYHKGDTVYLNSGIYTPYVNTLLWAANKSKIYEEYSDLDLINGLENDSFWIYIPNTHDSKVFNSKYSIGSFKTIVLKYESEIYKPSKEDIKCSDSACGRIYTFEGYRKFNNKTVNLVIIGENGEKSGEINISKYK
jgi:hypothetical protein